MTEPESTETPTETETATPPPDATLPTSDSPPPDPVAAEHEARLRAEGEAQALREELARARTAPPPTPTRPPTAADIQAAFDRGEISDAQRIQHLARLEAEAVAARQTATARQQTIQQAVQERTAAYVDRYPDLGRTGSELIRRVWADVATLAEMEGLDPNDARTQLRALERTLGPLTGGPAMGTTDRQRTRIPVGTGYSGGGGAGGPAAGGGAATDPLKDVPASFVAQWRRMGAKLDDPATAARYAARYREQQERRRQKLGGGAVA